MPPAEDIPTSGAAVPQTPRDFRTVPPMCGFRMGSPILGFGITRVSRVQTIPLPYSHPTLLIALVTCAISSPDCPTMVRKAFCCCCCCSGDRERRTALHSCCRREVGSRGCEERWKCCSMRRWGGGGGGDRADEIAAGATSVKENGAPLRVGGCRRRWACCRTDVEGESAYLSP